MLWSLSDVGVMLAEDIAVCWIELALHISTVPHSPRCSSTSSSTVVSSVAMMIVVLVAVVVVVVVAMTY